MATATLRSLQAGDEAALLDLLEKAFGRWPAVDTNVAPIEHLRWKLAAAAREDRFHCVAELDGRLVAAHLSVLHRVRARYGPAVALRTWDAAVHPDVQGRGIVGELRHFLLKEVKAKADFEIGMFTRSRTMQRVLERDGLASLGAELETLIAPLTLSAAISTLKLRPRRTPKKLARSVAALGRWVQAQASLRRSKHAGSHLQRFDERLAAFAEQASEPFDLLMERSPAYLNWRYADVRGGSFWTTYADEGGRPIGYVVHRLTGGHAYIADLIASPGRLDVVETLALDAVASFRRQGAATVACLIPSGHPYRSVLRRCGFVGRRRRKEPAAIVPLRIAAEELAFLQKPDLRLHLMFGDSDTI